MVSAPDQTPVIISSKARDAYTIYISWDKIPTADSNGIIKGYVVFYKIKGQSTYRNKTINDEGKLSTEITGLSPYTQVCVKLAAFTMAGLSKNWDQQPCTDVRTQQTGNMTILSGVVSGLFVQESFHSSLTTFAQFFSQMKSQFEQEVISKKNKYPRHH